MPHFSFLFFIRSLKPLWRGIHFSPEGMLFKDSAGRQHASWGQVRSHHALASTQAKHQAKSQPGRLLSLSGCCTGEHTCQTVSNFLPSKYHSSFSIFIGACGMHVYSCKASLQTEVLYAADRRPGGMPLRQPACGRAHCPAWDRALSSLTGRVRRLCGEQTPRTSQGACLSGPPKASPHPREGPHGA